MTDEEKKVQEALGTLRQCQHLDMDGIQCTENALPTPFSYHGDSELYHTYNDNDVCWVVIHLCTKHSRGMTLHT